MRLSICLSIFVLTLSCAREVPKSSQTKALNRSFLTPKVYDSIRQDSLSLAILDHNFFFQIDPAPHSDYPSQKIYNLQQQTAGEYEITLQTAAYLSGKITFSGKASQALEDAMRSRGSELPPSSDIIVRALLDTRQKNAQGSDNIYRAPAVSFLELSNERTFETELFRGIEYQLIWNPNGLNDLPPYYHRFFFNKDLELSILLDDLGPDIKGQITHPNYESPMNSLEHIYAIAAYDNDRLISSLAYSDKEGAFALKIFDKGERIDPKQKILIEAKPLKYQADLPTIVTHIPWSDISSGKLVPTFDLSDFANKEATTIEIEPFEDFPRKDISISISKKMGFGNVLFDERVSEQGELNVILPNGSYMFRITTPVQSRYHSKLIENLAINNQARVMVTLGERNKHTGFIKGPKGLPVPYAELSFRKVDSHKAGAPLSAQSGADGSICTLNQANGCDSLWLDNGRYQVTVTPPAGSNLPHFVEYLSLSENKHYEIRFPQPNILRGRVLSEDRTPLADAYVTIFSQSKTGSLEEDRVVARGITNPAGDFEAFVALRPDS